MIHNYKTWRKLNEQEDFNLDDMDLGDTEGFSKEDIISTVEESGLYFTEEPTIEDEGDGYLVVSFAHDSNYHGIHETNVNLVFTSAFEGEDADVISNMGIDLWKFERANISYEHNSPDFDWDSDTDDPRANYESDDYVDPNSTDEADELRYERFNVYADWIGKPINTLNDLKELLHSYQNLDVIIHLPSEEEKIGYSKEWGVAKEDERLSKVKDKLRSEAEASHQVKVDLFKKLRDGDKKYDPEFLELFKKTIGIKDSDLDD